MNDGWASYLLDEVHVAAELARLERAVAAQQHLRHAARAGGRLATPAGPHREAPARRLRLEHLHERLDQLVGAVGEHGDLAYQILEEKEWRER